MPGARSSGLRLLTVVTVMPGMLFAAWVRPLFWAMTISGPVACFVFLPRRLPLPARVFRLARTRWMSGRTPKCVSASSTCLVWVSSSSVFVTMRGIWGTALIAWPLAATVSFDAVAAIADNSARRFSFLGMLRLIFFWAVGGWGCLPPTVLGANLAVPPPPLMRGTRAIAMPVPRDSAVVRLPAMGSLPWGWCLCDCMASTARFITSGLSGVVKIVGRVVFVVGFPWRS